MSLDKAIESGQEKRKSYRGQKATYKSCRCHGGCLDCENSRQHKHKKQMLKSQEIE